jgi:DNA-binding IclR family transcriptional regulator
MTVLTAIAQNAAYGTSSEQISVLTGYKKTSKGEFLRQLKAAGYVAEEGQQYYATGDGLAALGDDFEPLPTGGALRAYWLGKLSGGEQTFLRHLIDGYPESFDLQTLMERTAYQKTSAGEYLRKLVARKLATRDRGVYRAADHLFD